MWETLSKLVLAGLGLLTKQGVEAVVRMHADRLAAENADMKVAADVTIADINAKRDLALAAISNRLLAFCMALMAFTVGIYFFKAIAVDKVIAPMFGYALSTDPIKGELLDWCRAVVYGLFGVGGVVGAAASATAILSRKTR